MEHTIKQLIIDMDNKSSEALAAKRDEIMKISGDETYNRRYDLRQDITNISNARRTFLQSLLTFDYISEEEYTNIIDNGVQYLIDE